MSHDEILTWWEETDGEGEDEEEYPHHPAEVYETQWGLGVVLCLPITDSEDYQTEDSEVNPDYVRAVEHTLALFYEAYPEWKGKTRIALDFDDGSDGNQVVNNQASWENAQVIIICS
tara:strand:+ start:426 stop:776 length:351 start_codon:yes stop_codon:yes gene_type:complete